MNYSRKPNRNQEIKTSVSKGKPNKMIQATTSISDRSNGENQRKRSQSIDKKIMDCVKAFSQQNPDVYYSQERQEMFLVENGLLKRTYPEIIPSLWPDRPYSSTMVKLLYSEMLHTFGTDRLLGSDQSISSLTPASTCLLQDGTVLTIQDFKPKVMKFAEWRGKPFFSQIKANFITDLCTAGYNYDLEILKAKAPKFYAYLHTSIDLAEARQRLCQMIGAVLTPLSTPSLPGVWNLIGNAGCGKSVITKFLKHIHPEEARAQIEPPTKYKRWGLSSLATSERAPHFLYTPDTSTADCYDSDYFKQIVFGDPIRVENKGVKPITIDKPLTWIISTNNHLKFRSDREQLEDKIPEIPFQTRINYRKERPAEYDEYLDYTLYKEEASEIVSFCWGVFARTVIQQEPVNFKLRQHVLEGELELNDLLKFLTKHVSYDATAETPIASHITKNGDRVEGIFNIFQLWMDRGGLQKWVEKDANGSVFAQPSQEFKSTFNKWLRDHGIRCCDKVQRFGEDVFRVYPLKIHLDYENQLESLKDDWVCSWECLSAKEIYSDAISADIIKPNHVSAELNQPETLESVSFVTSNNEATSNCVTAETDESISIDSVSERDVLESIRHVEEPPVVAKKSKIVDKSARRLLKDTSPIGLTDEGYCLKIIDVSHIDYTDAMILDIDKIYSYIKMQLQKICNAGQMCWGFMLSTAKAPETNLGFST